MGCHTIFVSCSGSDTGVRALVHRLKEQPQLSVWTYRMGGLPLGSEIFEASTNLVKRSDVFILALTEAALHSTYVADEVQAALSQPQRLLITLTEPQFTAIRPWHTWPAPFDRLTSFLCCPMDYEKLEVVEALVANLCERLKIQHNPPPPSPDDLPFVSRIYQELRGQFAARPEYEHAVFASLMRCAEGFHGAYRRRERERALALLDLLIATFHMEFPEALPYYAMIARALCCAELGRFDDAMRWLEECKVQCSESADPRYPDEVLFAAMGGVHYQLGRFDSAAENYREVLRRGSSDPADDYYLLLSHLQSAEEPKVNVDAELHKLKLKHQDVTDADRDAISLCRARIYRLVGRPDVALASLEPLLKTRASDPELLLEYAETLSDAGRDADSEATIEHWTGEGHLLLDARRTALQARYLASSAAFEAALWKFVDRYRQNRHAAFLAFRIFRESSLPKPAARAAGLVLDASRFGVPSSRFEFLMCAEANQFLSRDERARYDLERAGMAIG